jgi:hypothetical protein
MRRIYFPEPRSFNIESSKSGAPFGLADFILDRVLAMPENFSSVEACDRTATLYEKFEPLRNEKQKGKSVDVTDTEQEYLVRGFAAAVTQLAVIGQGVIPRHWVADFAEYARALHSAERVKEQKEQPKNGDELCRTS